MNIDLYALSNSALITDLGKRFATYRKRMGYTQKEISHHTGLSVFTISSFESGASTGITLASLLRILRAIESLEEIEKILPELPISPKKVYEEQQKTRCKKHKQLASN